MIKVVKQSIYAYLKYGSHLGDIIAMVQWACKQQLDNPYYQYYICSNKVCGCGCGRNAASQAAKVLELLNTKVKLVPFGKYSPNFSAPVFFYSNKQLVYQKAKNLPRETYDYITTQLIPTGDFESPSRKINVSALMPILGKRKIYNLSDKNIKGTTHFVGDLKQKLNLIASAKLHISVDSGCGHLSCMTNTPVVIIAPERYKNRYTSQSNVTHKTNVNGALPLIAKLLENPSKICKLL